MAGSGSSSSGSAARTSRPLARQLASLPQQWYQLTVVLITISWRPIGLTATSDQA